MEILGRTRKIMKPTIIFCCAWYLVITLCLLRSFLFWLLTPMFLKQNWNNFFYRDRLSHNKKSESAPVRGCLGHTLGVYRQNLIRGEILVISKSKLFPIKICNFNFWYILGFLMKKWLKKSIFSSEPKKLKICQNKHSKFTQNLITPPKKNDVMWYQGRAYIPQPE